MHVIDPVPGLEDMVFAANQVFVGEKAGYGKFVVPSPLRHPSRDREVPYFTQWFAARNFRVIDLALREDDHFEGYGDLLWDYEGSRIYAGYGFGSTRGAIGKFSAAMSEMGIPIIPWTPMKPIISWETGLW